MYVHQVKGIKARTHYDPKLQANDIEIHENERLPGYVMLLITMDENSYFPKVPFIKSTQSSNPVATDLQKFANGYIIACPVWPNVAVEWTTRNRLENWPSKMLVQSIKQDGCFVTMPDNNGFSRYVFYNAEEKLFQVGLSSNQIYCFIIVKLLCFQTLGCVEKFHPEVIKHVFLYTCERLPPDVWLIRSGSCVFYILTELQKCFGQGFLPHYFISSQNLIGDIPREKHQEIENSLSLLRSQIVLFLQNINSTLSFCSLGERVIEDVMKDSKVFTNSKNVKDSTIKCFVQNLMAIARDKICKYFYEAGLEVLNEAYQTRLTVSTCDDTISYHEFILGLLSELPIVTAVWFCAYADKEFAGHLPTTLIRDTCGNLPLTTIDHFLPKQKTGLYRSTEVPVYFTSCIEKFYHDFAAFLVFIGQSSEALAVLYHCIDKYKSRKDDETSFDDFTMFFIYSGLFAIYRRRGHLEPFQSSVEDMGVIVKRLNNPAVFYCLSNIHIELGDRVSSQRFNVYMVECYKSNPYVVFDNSIPDNCREWPLRFLTDSS